MSSAQHGSYRTEIDGLRAIAVLAVVLYHFAVPGLKAGFVGVDVFFVISGFLIGGMLWSEMTERGRIDLGSFYLRRIRRLAPAFFAMGMASMLIGWFVLLPYEFRNLGKELIASSLWMSNILFYREAGYFDFGAENRVLLHTWSLSVEEQFYIFLPLLLNALLLVRARPQLVLGVLVAVWTASLIGCIAFTAGYPVLTFYLFPFRAWEMLSGVLLAIWLQKSAPGPQLQALLAWTGIALLAASFMLIENTGFPGYQALLPVAGSAAVIAGAARARGNPGTFLSHPTMVFVGLISYSLYLWHWPLLILSRYWRGEYASPAETAAWLALVFVVATLSWRFVEQPFRRARWVTPPRLVGGAAFAACAVLSMGALSYVTNGMPDRFSRETQVYITASGGFLQDMSRCTRAGSGPLAGVETCAIGPEGKPEFLIWGDSHLRAQMDGLAMAAREAGRPGLIIWHAGCPPLFGLAKQESAATPDQDRACMDDNRRIRAAIRQFPDIHRLLLVGRWAYYADGKGVGRDAHNVIRLAPEDGSGLPRNVAQADLFGAALKLTVAELNGDGYEVYLMRQVPELPQYDSIRVARDMAYGRLTADQARTLASVQMPALRERTRLAEAPIDQLVADRQVRLIDPWPRLCADKCSGMQNGTSLYFDNNHMTYAGAVSLRDLFIPFLSGSKPGRT
ncbi:acyltransferase family protein [Novosphingobium kaempferiae]|uniref:acyltransferase family protein n=1 Tax=Novosphingobium kaempferiae TaxID=2896849 RepID=UPI001E503D64|nr:acyltransferase family protein [Novosphingobium kaempferiae]